MVLKKASPSFPKSIPAPSHGSANVPSCYLPRLSHSCVYVLQRPITDVAVFLLPSFEGAGDDHQRALLHAVSESSTLLTWKYAHSTWISLDC
jgi:hypothetical protein